MKQNSKHIKAELAEAPLLLALKQKGNMFFSFPKHYFEELPNRIMSRASIDPKDEAAVFGDGQQVSRLDNSPSFRPPAGYFSSFSERLQAKIDKEAEAPLQQFSRENAFTAPAGYFEHLPERISEKVQSSQRSKTIPMFHSRWYQMAAAIVLLLGLYWIFAPTQQTVDPLAELEETEISTETLLAMIDIDDHALETLAEGLSDAELNEIEAEMSPILEDEAWDAFMDEVDLSDLEDIEVEVF